MILLGFGQIRYLHSDHRDPLEAERFGPQEDGQREDEGPDEMFRFVKRMK